MRTSQFFLNTLRDAPNDAEVASHRWMIQTGMIRKTASGIYNWLPLGLRILRKVEHIVREEMNRIGAQELLLPIIQPAELWKETNRWEQYGPCLLTASDRNGREYCFGPTHEEIITDLARGMLKSHKQLPLVLYQIQTKFRDEIRPRFGVMRAREFLMKDAYSFHLDADSLRTTYQEMHDAYYKIFSRLGLDFRVVAADGGNIGGSNSQEFHVLANSGEDTLAFCPNSSYAANVEVAEAARPAERAAPQNDLSTVQLPQNCQSVADQAAYLKCSPAKILKTLFVRGTTPEHPIVALLLRGDHELNEIKVEKLSQVASPYLLVPEEELQTFFGLPGSLIGFLGPRLAAEKNIPLLADFYALALSDFYCGANQPNTLYSGFNWARDCAEPIGADLRQVQAGDPSPDGAGPLALAQGIEVGHIFQLEDKYSKAMKATVLDTSGKARVMLMGCYGIGVSRIVAAAIEQNHDEKGILWPAAMAPFQVALVPIDYHRSERVRQQCGSLYESLVAAGYEVLLDDRKESPGVLFTDMEMIGIPYRIVISEKTLDKGQVECKERRTGNTEWVAQTEIVPWLNNSLCT